MDDNAGKIVQIQHSLCPVVRGPSFLCIILYDTFASQHGLIPFLQQVDRFFHRAFEVWSEGRQCQDLKSISFAQFSHAGTEKLTPLIRDDLRWHPSRWPLLWYDLDSIASTVLNLIHGSLLNASHHSSLVACKANIDTGDQVGGCIYCHVNIRSANNDRSVCSGHQIDIRLCGVHLIRSWLWPPSSRGSPCRPVIPLVFCQPLSCDDLLRILV